MEENKGPRRFWVEYSDTSFRVLTPEGIKNGNEVLSPGFVDEAHLKRLENNQKAWEILSSIGTVPASDWELMPLSDETKKVLVRLSREFS